ncbi:MAG: Pr6Pr family membrane protein [Candidatus Dormibacteraeota bacterium]|nr:Pr6Pr family membrane protein [Candidatus Dormibacteraeota bacterium]
MSRSALVAAYRVVFALLAIVAIVTQAVSLANLNAFRPGNFFSFFTILSNLIAIVVFLVGAARWRSRRSDRFDLVRGAAVVYMTITGIVYFFLLSGIEVDTSVPWVNAVVHQVMPIVVVADWLIDPPVARLTQRQGLLWLCFPAAWTVYTLIRGPIAHWYPYPFLNPANGGYGVVLLYCLGILILFVVVCAAAVAVANALGGRRRRVASIAG